jgi:hypothetical protein
MHHQCNIVWLCRCDAVWLVSTARCKTVTPVGCLEDTGATKNSVLTLQGQVQVYVCVRSTSRLHLFTCGLEVKLGDHGLVVVTWVWVVWIGGYPTYRWCNS